MTHATASAVRMVIKKYRGVLLAVVMLCAFVPLHTSALSMVTANNKLPTTGFAAIAPSSCMKEPFFGLIPWYAYLGPELDDGSHKDTDGHTYKCDLKCFNITEKTEKNRCGQTKSDIPLVLLAIVDDLLRITALVAIGYVFYGAFRYTASQGNPEHTAKAQNTILNALLGLAISTIAVGFVAFLGHTLGG